MRDRTSGEKEGRSFLGSKCRREREREREREEGRKALVNL